MSDVSFRVLMGILLIAMLSGVVICSDSSEAAAGGVGFDVEHNAHATITVNGQTVSSGGYSRVFSSGDTVTLAASVSMGYQFLYWTVDYGNGDSSRYYSPTVTEVIDESAEGYTFTLHVQSIENLVDLDVDHNAHATITVNGQTVSSSGYSGGVGGGSLFTLSADVHAGYRFVRWTVQFGNGDSYSYFTPTISEIADPSSGGYSFTLITEAIGVPYVSVGYNPNATITVNGQTVGSTGLRQQFQTGASVTVSALPKAGYEFVSWTATSSSVLTYSSPTVTITVGSSDISLTSSISAMSYTITFDPNGGDLGSAASSKTVTYGQALGALPTPTRSGWTFLGWYTDPTVGSMMSSTSIYRDTEGRVLYAHWEQNVGEIPLEVRYNPSATITVNGQTVSSGGYSRVFSSGDTVTLTASVSMGHQFLYWTADYGNGDSSRYYSPTVTEVIDESAEGYTFTLITEAVSYTVTFDPNGGNIISTFDSKSVVWGQPYGALPIASLPGYRFTGWFTESAGGQRIDSDSIVSSYEYRLYAQFSILTYPVTVEYNSHATIRVDGSTISQDFVGNYTAASEVILTATPEPGYAFIKWVVSINDGNFIETSHDQELTITIDPDSADYVVSLYVGQFHTVTFDPNGGELDDPSQASKVVIDTTEYGALPTARRAFYDFLGWYTAATGGSRVDSSSIVNLSGDQTLYAHYTIATYSIEVRHNSHATITVNGQTVSSGGYSGLFSVGSTVTISAAVDVGFQFDRWILFDLDLQETMVSRLVTTVIEVDGSFENLLVSLVVADESGFISVNWSNDQANGSVDLLYNFSSSGPYAIHVMSASLYSGEYNESTNRTDWTPTDELMTVSISPDSSTIRATYTAEGVFRSADISIGSWTSFIVSMDPSNGMITFTPCRTFTNFSNYTLFDSQKVTILDFSDLSTGHIIREISHRDSPTGDNVKFSVVRTMVFLESYGVVMQNPSLDVDAYFPQYSDLRLNFYSFAIYGDSITLNGRTYATDGAKITVEYDEKAGGKYYPGLIDDGVRHSKTVTLTNLYVTWEDGRAYLTFQNDRLMIDMGPYSGHRMISFGGIWYFACQLYEPQTDHVMELGEWPTLPTIDYQLIILLFLFILIVSAAVCRIHFKSGLLDLVIIGCVAVSAYVLLG